MNKTMKQRASKRLWDIIANRAVDTVLPAKLPRTKKEYSPKEYVSPAERKASKESGGIPTQFLDAEERRKRSRFLRGQRQQGVKAYA